MPSDAELARRLIGRIWRTVILRRAGLWVAGAVPWLALRNAPGLLAWSAFCAWDGLRLQRQVAHGWADWIDAAVPEMEDSSVLLAEAHSPIAQLQRARLVKRLEDSLDGARLRAIARARVRLGLPWMGPNLLMAALAWATVTHPHAGRVVAASPIARKASAAPTRPELLVKLAPPAYTGVAASESAPRDVQAPEQTVVEWCVRTPSSGTATETIELSDGQLLHAGRACARWTATESMFWRWRGERYTLKVIPDQPPEIVITRPGEMSHDLARDAKSAKIGVSVRDDYRVQQATMHLTLARGSGENIKFSDRELPLPASSDPKRRVWARDWALSDLGMEPGDELYFFIRASDNALKPHVVQSPTYTLRLPAPPSKDDEQTAALPLLVKPESLRSQRQIIIDTEQLVADMRNRRLPAAEVRERSESIAADEGVLRRRYGQFLGEESTLFGKGDDDDHHEAHGKSDILHEFGHAHDQPENATLFDDATKKVLRRALSAMWDAEKALRVSQPKTALPPEYKALEAIKELQQAERIYLHKTSSEIPAIKEDKRLSGDMTGAASYKREQADANDPVPAQLKDVVRLLATDGPLPALWTRTAHDWVRERIADDGQRLAAQRAIQDVADGCLACRPVLRAWLRAGVTDAPVLLQARPVVETPFSRALREGSQ